MGYPGKSLVEYDDTPRVGGLSRHARGGKANSWADGPHREPVVAAVVVPAAPARIEAEVAGEAAVGRAERTRPVVASAAGIVE